MAERRGEQFGFWTVDRATEGLPATTSDNLFAVTGKVKILSIRGEVTTAIQDTAGTVAINAYDGTTATNLAAATSVRNNGVGTLWAITGTVANSIQTAVAGGIYQLTPSTVDGGSGYYIRITTNATQTGSVKWSVDYVPLDPGATVEIA